MKKTMFILCSAMLASAVSAAIYKVNEFHTSARFVINHFNASTSVDGIYGSTGSLEFNRAKRQGSIDIVLPLSELQIGSEYFTQHLKSIDIFNMDKYPEIRLVSIKFSFNDRKLFFVDDSLTMNGKITPVRLKADEFNCYQSPMLKAEVCGDDFSTTIDHIKWGLDYLINTGTNEKVDINIQIETAKQ